MHLVISSKKNFLISGTQLCIKNEKLRLFDIKHKESDHVLIKLRKDVFQPSGVKLFPKYVSNFEQLYDRSVSDNKTLKIRDNIQKPSINSSKLSNGSIPPQTIALVILFDKYLQANVVASTSIIGSFNKEEF